MVVAHSKSSRRSKDCLDGNEVMTVYHARMPVREVLFPDRLKKVGRVRTQMKTVPRR